MILGPLVSMAGNRKICMQPEAKPNREDLIFIKELIEAGKVKPVIDRRYPLSKAAEAIRYLERGHARGKVIIII
jgi:NADPH:quinone reductase-like Zn-dependent oxidoreductase